MYVGGQQKPLAASYAGPYLVVSKGAKTFTIQVGQRQKIISVDHLEADTGPYPVSPEAVDMNGRFQMQGGKNWFLPKEMNANRFFWDSHWLEIWSNHFYPSMGPNGGSVAMDSAEDNSRGCPSKKPATPPAQPAPL